MPDERTRLDELNRFWNDLVIGRPGAGDHDLAAEELDAIRRFHTRGTAPLPSSAREQAWRDVLARIESPSARSDKETPVTKTGFFELTIPATGTNGRIDALPHRRPRVRLRTDRRRWLFAQVATALLFLVTLFGIYLSFRPGSDKAVAPITGTATPIPAPAFPSVSTLLDLAWPAGYIPVTENSFFFFGRYSIAPGKALDFYEPCSGGNLTVSYVETGTYAVRAAGPFEVLRGATSGQPATPEAVAAGIEAQLHPGDALLYRNLAGDDRTGFRNPGPDPLVVLETIWTTDNNCVNGYANNMDNVWDSYDYQPIVDPSRPVTFILSHVTVAPGAIISGDQLDSLVGTLGGDTVRWQRVYVESGKLEVDRMFPTEGASPTPRITEVFAEGRRGMGGTGAATLDPPHPAGPGQPQPAATTTQLRNVGDGPLVLTVLTVALGEPVGTPATSGS